MASKFTQVFPVPEEFPSVLKDFAKEILRQQPPNILEYAALYFEALEAGKSPPFAAHFNVAKETRKNIQQAPKILPSSLKKLQETVKTVAPQFDPQKKGSVTLKHLGSFINKVGSFHNIRPLTDKEVGDKFRRYLEEGVAEIPLSDITALIGQILHL